MRRYSSMPLFAMILGLVLALFAPLPGLPAISVASAAELPNGNGYADFKYHVDGKMPTGEKPQSKLWHNDGRWWADMIYPDGNHYIFYLDLASQTWVKTNTLLDSRTKTKSDCLWDGTHLYVVSGGGQVSTGTNLDALLYRYSYNPSTQTYSLNSGFPVTVRTGGAEAVVLDKDSTGQLWITYTQNNKVWVNRSTTADNVWNPAAAFNPPSAPSESNSATVDQDDISSLVAFDDKIGVIWSKHSTAVTTDPNAAFYFSYREDGTADTIAAWQTKKIYSGPNLSDDHMSLKSLQVAGKEVYAVVKTSLAGTSTASPMIVLLGRRADGSWITPVVVSSAADGQTRPVLLLDPEQRKLHIFTSTEGGGNIYYKQSSMDSISFPPGKGTIFIESGSGINSINNATSTKQTVNSATGIAILASDDNVKWYAHRYMALGSGGPRAVFDPSQWIGAGQAGVALDPQPVVLVQSQPGQTDTSYNGPVSIAIKSGSGTAGASLWGSTTVNAVDGVARFSNLSISKAGTGYRLTASVPSRASGDSNAFDIAIGSQTISFPALANKRYGDPPFTLNASATSQLPVSYSASGACALSAATLTITGVGGCSITASQAGDASFTPAPNVTRVFSISKRGQVISFGTLPNRHYSDTPFAISATASSGLAVGFSASGICTTAGGMVNLLGIGSCTITASQAGNALYDPAPPVVRSFTVLRFFNIFVPLIRG
jgi:hypothetical protein